MEISSVNGVKNSLNVTKQENNEINSANIEPKKDGNKKIAMALAALAATAAAGVGVAVAAKKGKINLPKLENSVKNAADDIGKVVKDTTDDAAKAAKGAADDVGKVVKDTADDAVKGAVDDVADVTIKQSKMPQGRNEIVEECTQNIKRLQKELKDGKNIPFVKREIVEEQHRRWSNMEAATKNTLSARDKAVFDSHLKNLDAQIKKMDLLNNTPEVILDDKKMKLYKHTIDTFKEGCQDETGKVTAKMNGLMNELKKHSGQDFKTPEQAVKFAESELAKTIRHKLSIVDDILKVLEESHLKHQEFFNEWEKRFQDFI